VLGGGRTNFCDIVGVWVGRWVVECLSDWEVGCRWKETGLRAQKVCDYVYAISPW
jgi:hypothetical protein